jgi:hypothetical protein
VSNVDEKAGVIRIEQTKSGAARTLPYASLPLLAKLVEKRRQVTDVVQKKRGMVVTHVFHRNASRSTTSGDRGSPPASRPGLGRK